MAYGTLYNLAHPVLKPFIMHTAVAADKTAMHSTWFNYFLLLCNLETDNNVPGQKQLSNFSGPQPISCVF